jgi:carbonic anhydrase
MDPRVNLEAVGLESFDASGALGSPTRVIRTLGAIPDVRSLVVAVHLAGVREVAILMHTDCGATVAWARAANLLENAHNNLGDDFARLVDAMGGDDVDSARIWLRAFDDPRVAVAREVSRLRDEALLPRRVPIHGLVLDLETAAVDVVVDGYAEAAR